MAAALRGAAEAAQACLVEGVPEQVDRLSVPMIRLGQEDAARLLGIARPKAVYMIEVPFDPEEAINDAAESLAELGVEKLPASLKAAHRRVADRAGEICTTLAAFMVDGVLHTAVASADWHDAFDEAVDEMLDAARADAETQGQAGAKAANAEIAAKAAILAAHPSFNFSRVSFDKRLTLAEALFKDCDDQELREVTRVAENLFWLEQSGFTSRG
ncbi:MAG: hypothetical protein B7Y81_14705 [Caulobacter sp. 32-67-35]|nr:MAG: hypothetical protein B7Y81_14705 [Caulobacter sp. 32-67-35]